MRKNILLSATAFVALVMSGCAASSVSTTTDTSNSVNDSSSQTKEDSATKDTSSDKNTNNTEGTIKQETIAEIVTSATNVIESAHQDIEGELKVDTEVTEGYSISGDMLCINKGGDYLISGKFEGSIRIDVSEDEKVELMLAGLSLTSNSQVPVYVVNADTVTISAKDGTYNEIIDNRSLSEDSEDKSSAIYSKCDLKFKGQGTLVVNSQNSGIHSKKDIDLKNLTLLISSKGYGIKGNTGVDIASGNYYIATSEGDGIKTTDNEVNKKGNQKGNVNITGGSIEIHSAGDGIDCAYDINISTEEIETNVVIITGENVNSNGEASGSMKGLKADNKVNTSSLANININSSDSGIKAATADLGASITSIVSKGDGISITEAFVLSAGTVVIESEKKGIDAATVEINGDNLSINKSVEGIEGRYVTINSGNISIYGSDDGINATEGSSDGTGKFNMNQVADAYVKINGGNITVATPSGDTDAIDSNGDYIQNGGKVLVLGGAASGTVCGSIDVNGSIKVTAGDLIALGGVCETVEESVNAYVSTGTDFDAGSYVIKNSSGEIVIDFEISQSYSSCQLASDKFTVNETYTVYNGDNEVLSWTQEEGTMGSANSGFNGGPGGNFGGGGRPDKGDRTENFTLPEGETFENPPEGFTPPEGDAYGNRPNGNFPGGGMKPDDFSRPDQNDSSV